MKDYKYSIWRCSGVGILLLLGGTSEAVPPQRLNYSPFQPQWDCVGIEEKYTHYGLFECLPQGPSFLSRVAYEFVIDRVYSPFDLISHNLGQPDSLAAVPRVTVQVALSRVSPPESKLAAAADQVEIFWTSEVIFAYLSRLLFQNGVPIVPKPAHGSVARTIYISPPWAAVLFGLINRRLEKLPYDRFFDFSKSWKNTPPWIRKDTLRSLRRY